MRTIYAIDPGYEQSALIVFDGQRVLEHATLANEQLLRRLSHTHSVDTMLVVEQIASFGMPVGAEVFETVFWSGRFIQAWNGLMPWARIKRHEVKTALCHNKHAKDAHIRQALIDRFGPGRQKAIGTKHAQGPLYGIRKDEWAALAVAVAWRETHQFIQKVG